jgi:hypothetical protein
MRERERERERGKEQERERRDEVEKRVEKVTHSSPAVDRLRAY